MENSEALDYRETGLGYRDDTEKCVVDDIRRTRPFGVHIAPTSLYFVSFFVTHVDLLVNWLYMYSSLIIYLLHYSNMLYLLTMIELCLIVYVCYVVSYRWEK